MPGRCILAPFVPLCFSPRKVCAKRVRSACESVYEACAKRVRKRVRSVCESVYKECTKACTYRNGGHLPASLPPYKATKSLDVRKPIDCRALQKKGKNTIIKPSKTPVPHTGLPEAAFSVSRAVSAAGRPEPQRCQSARDRCQVYAQKSG